jgi:hypothetical protein
MLGRPTTYLYQNAGNFMNISSRWSLAAFVVTALLALVLDATGAEKAKCRVVITGFKVHTETHDDLLQRDGKRDEVYVETLVILPGEGKDDAITSTRTSLVMGDVHNQRGRIQAGTEESGKGGLKSGDTFPTETPHLIKGDLKQDRLPMIVFDTVIEEGDTVIIVPSIIEWDIGTDALKTFRDTIGKTVLKAVLGAVDPALAEIPVDGLLSAFGESGSRPIGIENKNEADAGKKTELVYKPWTIRLTPRTAKRLATTDFGNGKGVLEHSFEDCKDLGSGKYQLFVKFELIPVDE